MMLKTRSNSFRTVLNFQYVFGWVWVLLVLKIALRRFYC